MLSSIVYHNMIIYLPVDGYLGYFYWGAIINKAAMSIHVQVFM